MVKDLIIYAGRPSVFPEPEPSTKSQAELNEDRLENIPNLDKIRQKRREMMNAPITMSDIHARSTEHGGESARRLSDDPMPRIQETIRDLGQLVNKYHMNENSGNPNAVTRLTTNEFAFYPSGRPMSVSEFHGLIKNIEKMATGLSQNVILVLSSFPVLGSDGQIHNTVVHVQGGERPKIDVFAKTTLPSGELGYSGFNLADHTDLTQADVIPMVPSDDPSPFLISRNSAVAVETSGGAQFFNLVDVCSDHLFGVAKQNLRAEIRERLQNQYLDAVPEQVSHVITSSSVFANSANKIGNHVMHADSSPIAIGPMQLKRHQKLDDKQLDYLSEDNPRVLVDEEKRAVSLNPSFGSRLEISFLKRHRLDKLKL